MDLPVAAEWYRAAQLDDRLWRVTEPHVHPIFSANIHLVLGRDRDLLVDSGMGVARLRPFVDRLRPDPDKPLICLTTHTHIDHMGAVDEFDTRLVHPIEAQDMQAPPKYSLRSACIPQDFRDLFLAAGYELLWPLLIDALPAPGYDPDSYVMPGAPPTATVEEGDVIDLGDWQAQVLHLPGHSPGQVGLWHHASGTLFGADAVYDGPLLYQGPGMDIGAYTQTLRRLRTLPVNVVHGGHDLHFGKARLDGIIDHYLTTWHAADA